jgi:hypothetical protein
MHTLSQLYLTASASLKKSLPRVQKMNTNRVLESGGASHSDLSKMILLKKIITQFLHGAKMRVAKRTFDTMALSLNIS